MPMPGSTSPWSLSGPRSWPGRVRSWPPCWPCSAPKGAQVASVFLALAAVLLITWLTFRYAGALLRLLRESGIVLLSRIAGLLLSAIAVQMIADSVRAFIEA